MPHAQTKSELIESLPVVVVSSSSSASRILGSMSIFLLSITFLHDKLQYRVTYTKYPFYFLHYFTLRTIWKVGTCLLIFYISLMCYIYFLGNKKSQFLRLNVLGVHFTSLNCQVLYVLFINICFRYVRLITIQCFRYVHLISTVFYVLYVHCIGISNCFYMDKVYTYIFYTFIVYTDILYTDILYTYILCTLYCLYNKLFILIFFVLTLFSV